MKLPLEYRWLKAHGFKLISPWDDVELDSSEAQALQNEYRRETESDILIFGRRTDQDDVVGYEVNNGHLTGKVLEVHLTWSKRKETTGFPSTGTYSNILEWIKKSMFSEFYEWMDEDDLLDLLEEDD